MADKLQGEVRASGPGEALAALLLFTAMYLDPLLGSAPWQASLALTCLAGGVLVVMRPSRLRRVPLVLAAYVAIYGLVLLVSGISPEASKGSEFARYILRPVAIGALALFLTTAASRRRVVGLVVLLALPQVLVTAVQGIDTVIDLGELAQNRVDAVTGTFGDYEAGTVGLVALAAICLVAGLAFTGLMNKKLALAIAVLLLAVQVFTGTRAAVVFGPLVAVALVAGALAAFGRRVPRRTLAIALTVGILSGPGIYLATETMYPGSFTGAFSNQRSQVLEAKRVAEAKRAAGLPGPPPPAPQGPTGTALLPGRATQIKRAAEISTEDGLRVFLFGRGYGAARVRLDARVDTILPKEQTTGLTWLGRNLGDAGWVATIAFFALIGWIAWLSLRIARRAAEPSDRALGVGMIGICALTLAAAAYTTILDVRGYSAVFIVLAAATFAAAADLSGSATASGNGRRQRASTPLPPRQHSTPSAPSATSARSS
jgi:hypothetical protein